MSGLLLSQTPRPGTKAPVFSFAASSIAYNSLERAMTYSWGKQPTVHPGAKKGEGANTAQQCYTKQFGGVGKDEITLTGLLYPLHVKGGLTRIDHLRQLAASGKPMSLIVSDDTTAKKLGKYVVTNITETQSEFTSTSDSAVPASFVTETFVAPQKVNFTVTLSSFSTCSVVGAGQEGNSFPGDPGV